QGGDSLAPEKTPTGFRLNAFWFCCLLFTPASEVRIRKRIYVVARRRFSGTRENPHGIPFKRFLVLLSFFVHLSQQSANTQTHLCCSKAAPGA
ncbi:hypothetical protein, partial [Pantoea ananatis]|uniref:hypothetical protein n=1 Tax=Pantoea ananas TaxID=553 RepID=UPI0023B0752B